MRKNKLLLLLALLMTAATGAWAQEVIPVTLDFTSNSWGIPAGSEEKTAAENSYTSGGYTITLCGSSGNGYYFSPTEPYILLGKQGAYLQLPAFSSAVDSIKVVGSPNATTAVEQNIYVGDVAVSTATTGMKNVTQKYVIAENYRTAGTIYRIKVTSAHNTQIKKVLVYFTPASGYSVTMKDGTEDADNWTGKAGDATEYQKLPLEGVAEGAALTLKYSGTKKVLGVKAEKKAKGLSISLNNPAVGQLIGNDGKNYNYGAVPTGVTALAMICHISGDHGVALALEDYGFNTWNAVKEALENYEPKFTNATWDMPTEDEWGQMNQTAGGYGALRDSFANVGGTNMSKSSYWSSTSVDANNAKNFSFFNGSWSSYGKNNNRYTRLRLAWYPPFARVYIIKV